MSDETFNRHEHAKSLTLTLFSCLVEDKMSEAFTHSKYLVQLTEILAAEKEWQQIRDEKEEKK